MKRIDVSWCGGFSNLFIEVKGDKPVLLDYEYDTELLHEMCGGRCYYRSRSGCSGAGYVESLGSLVKVGSYRVDTAYIMADFVSVGKTSEGKEVLVAVPYASHTSDKSEILRDYPVVIKTGLKVVYCDFGANFLEILSLILSGKDLPEECMIDCITYNRRGHRTIRKTLTRVDDWGHPLEEEVVIEHYNLCSMRETPGIGAFLFKELYPYLANNNGRERMFQLLGVEKLPNGQFVRAVMIGGVGLYRGEILPGNPLETDDLTVGWQRLADDVLVRFYDRSNEVHLVAYVKASEAYGFVAQRLADRLGEGEEFVSFVSACEDKYVEYEAVVPKMLYVLDPDVQVEAVRNAWARKVHADVIARTRQWVDKVSDQTILEAIPDDLVVTFDDSLAAGNCRPGTEAFVAQYFPGQTSATAGELKKFSDDYNVMRIFRHLAATGRFSWKAKTTE